MAVAGTVMVVEKEVTGKAGPAVMAKEEMAVAEMVVMAETGSVVSGKVVMVVMVVMAEADSVVSAEVMAVVALGMLAVGHQMARQRHFAV